MLIIVEGAKYSGKSTLCAQLAKQLGCKVIHFPTDSVVGKTAMTLLNSGEYAEAQNMMRLDIDNTLAKLDPTQNWVLDRSFISNAIYRDGDIVLYDRYLNILDESMLIILLCNDETLFTRMKMRTMKPSSEVEVARLTWSNARFKQLATQLEAQELAIDRSFFPRIGNYVLANH